jgi:hypothetical protein
MIRIYCQVFSYDQGLVLQKRFSDLRKSQENFKPSIFCQKDQKNYLADVLAWLAY